MYVCVCVYTHRYNFVYFCSCQQSRRKNPKRRGENLDDLKQELDIDFHKISPEELYQRFQTHPENVSKLFKTRVLKIMNYIFEVR